MSDYRSPTSLQLLTEGSGATSRQNPYAPDARHIYALQVAHNETALGQGEALTITANDVDTFDAEVLHPDLVAFQFAQNTGATGQQIAFWPYGSNTVPKGRLLLYDARRSFSVASSYEHYDLPSIVDPQCMGFLGAAMDDQGYAYPVPKTYSSGGSVLPSTKFFRWKTWMKPDAPGAWESFDLSTHPSLPAGMKYGWALNWFMDGFVYYSPVSESSSNGAVQTEHGNIVRVHTRLGFTASTSWQVFDMTGVTANAKGYQGIIGDGQYIMLPGFLTGTFTRYNTRAATTFLDAASYSTFVTTTLNAGAKGYTGQVKAGRFLVFPNWTFDSATAATIAACYDTRDPNITSTDFSSRSAWSFFDTTTLGATCKGYQGAWVDGAGDVWFCPTNSFGGGVPPLIKWSPSLGPFADPSAWVTLGSAFSVGCLLPNYRAPFGYCAPYAAAGGFSGLIHRVRCASIAPSEWRARVEKRPRLWAGVGSGKGVIGGNLYSTYGATGTAADTNETDLATYTVPANTLVMAGRRLRITGFGTFGANANLKRVRLYWGGTAVADTTALSLNGGGWRIDADIGVEGTDLQRVNASFTLTVALGTTTYQTSTSGQTKDDGADIVVKVTGQNGTASANDIRLTGFSVDFL